MHPNDFGDFSSSGTIWLIFLYLVYTCKANSHCPQLYVFYYFPRKFHKKTAINTLACLSMGGLNHVSFKQLSLKLE